MKTISSQLILLIICFRCFSQISIDWESKIYPSDISDSLLSVTYETSIMDSLDNLYVVLHPNNSWEDTILLLKFDPDGVLIYQTMISDSIYCHGCPYKMIFSTDNNLMIAFEEYSGGSIVKINPANGSILWTTTLPFQNTTGINCYDLKIGPDNNIWTLYGFYVGTNYEFWFAKISQNGQILKTFKSPVFHSYSVYDGIYFDQSNNLVYLKGDWDGVFPSQYFFSTLVKIDTAGNLVEDFVLPPVGTDVYYTYKIDNSRNYILSGNNSGVNSNGNLRLMKVDQDFNTIWQKAENLGYESFANVKIDNLNNIYAYGSKNYQNSGQYDMFVIKYDSLGNKLWQYNYPDNNNNDENSIDFHIDKDGNPYLFGVSGANTTYNSYILVKLDTSGSELNHWINNSGERLDNGINDIYFNNFDDIIWLNNRIDSTYYFTMFKLCTDSCRFNVSGTTYFDSNNNCIQDSSELGLTGRFLKIDPGNYYAASDRDGNYYFRIPFGAYNLEQFVPQHWSVTCPAGGHSFALSLTDTTEFGIKLGSYIDPNARDLSIGITGSYSWIGLKQNHVIHYKNQGAQIENGQIILTLDPVFDSLASTPLPDTVLGNTYTFNFTNLLPGENRIIDISTTTDTTDPVFYVYGNCVQILPDNNDLDLSNNSDCDSSVIINIPFARTSEPELQTLTVAPGIFEDDKIIFESDSILTYTIRFVNPYDRNIKDLIIRDEISENLDIMTLEVISASHDFEMSIVQNNVIQWKFNDINLTSASSDFQFSSGFIKFKIKLSDNISQGAIIENQALLYFDYGVTNPSNLTRRHYQFISNSINDVIDNNSITVYPNPTCNYVTIKEIKSKSSIHKRISIYDLSGNRLMDMLWEGGEKEISLEYLNQGIYILMIETGNTVLTKKIVKIN